MAAKSVNLRQSTMSIPETLLFTFLFLLMGISIMLAGIKGQEATAPIVLSIGMMMNIIGIGPFFQPIIHKLFVQKKINKHPEIAI